MRHLARSCYFIACNIKFLVDLIEFLISVFLSSDFSLLEYECKKQHCILVIAKYISTSFAYIGEQEFLLETSSYVRCLYAIKVHIRHQPSFPKRVAFSAGFSYTCWESPALRSC